MVHGIIGFTAFSVLSSSIYIINDIADVEKDRKHPVKCKRPIASGEVKIHEAWTLFAMLLLVSVVCNAAVGNKTAWILSVMYFGLNVGYSFGWKNIPLVDIAILVSGFVMRVIYGSVVTCVPISDWLLLTVLSVSLYMALGKRRNELKRNGDGQTREVLRAYPVAFLDKTMNMSITMANVFYALWCMSGSSSASASSLIATVPVILLLTMRYEMIVEGDSDGDPVEVMVHDKVLIVLSGIYILAMAVSIYFLPVGFFCR